MTSLVSIFDATASEANARLTTTCNTEMSSSGTDDFQTDSIGCIMSAFTNNIAKEVSDAKDERAEQACSTTWRLSLSLLHYLIPQKTPNDNP